MRYNKKGLYTTIAVVLALIIAPSIAAQNQADFSAYADSFGDFAGDVANSLPLNSSVGLNTSEAYIGQLLSAPPSIGVGLTGGASTLPYDTVSAVFSDLQIDMPSELDRFKTLGVPLPAGAVDVRVGGILIPFDLGVKFGTVVPQLAVRMPSDMSVDYTLAGADVRFPVMEGGALLPAVSVGAGYNYLRGSITMKDVISSRYQIDLSQYYPTYTSWQALALDNPDATFNWSSNVIDLKAQASKNFLIFTPYLGAGASYAKSSAGGGLEAALLGDQGGGFNPMTPAEVEQLKQDLRDIENQTGEDFNLESLSANNGIGIERAVNGWAFRLFGGTSVNLLFMRLDLGLGYDLLGKNVSGTVGLRMQL